MTNLESKLLASLLYPPGFWRSYGEIIELMYDFTEPENAKGVLQVMVMRIRRKIFATPLRILAGYHRGMILLLPELPHGN